MQASLATRMLARTALRSAPISRRYLATTAIRSGVIVSSDLLIHDCITSYLSQSNVKAYTPVEVFPLIALVSSACVVGVTLGVNTCKLVFP